MSRVEVTAGTVNDGRIAELTVRLVHLDTRTLTRDQALAWMKDGHSFIPVIDGQDLPALQLVEVVEGDETLHLIRDNHEPVAQDSLPFG